MLRLQVPRLRLATAKCLQNHLGQEGSNPRPVFSHQHRSLITGKVLLKSDFSQNEIRACYRLFQRSGLLDPKSPRFLQLSSSALPRLTTCQFHSSSSHNSEKVDPDDKKGKEGETEIDLKLLNNRLLKLKRHNVGLKTFSFEQRK
jgi:hypothetical protein